MKTSRGAANDLSPEEDPGPSHKEKLDFKRAREICNSIFEEFGQEEVVVVDGSFRIVDASSLPLEKYGLTKGHAIGRRCHEIFHHQKTYNEDTRYTCPLAEVKKTGKPHRCVHIHLDKEGRKLIHSISSYPVFEGEKVAGMVQFLRDITWETNLQKHFGDQEKLAAIGRLAAGVAHEINNPLTTILTSAMLIQEDIPADNPEHEELALIAKEALRCRNIVSNLLDFARQSEPCKSDQDVNDIVAEAAALVRKPANFKDIRLTCDLHGREIQAHCDKAQILQCLVNLALNAIDATEPGGTITFETKLLPEGNWMEITVADTGPGLPENIVDKIFEPFFTTKPTGTGLGLSITHGFVRQHRGFISVENRADIGAAFTIRLPVRGAKAPVVSLKKILSVP
ncbi:PAS/PAC sensor signal transduction histidine kinase [Desulfatibacillum aliphaticivorans]|uniref:histidine kinase n=1 Tax=Desulfatibacillum aliphaticivorans TaxID=218208 RepID=B8FIH1_DESAL|nr:ATP-binding protein [Desulfatibacillum aliphaticivorans]ACL03961.1 PAS/PAC sensor signal transduction histidine kinase [Desulfatibacillum aliphaticivorans]